MKPTVTFLFSGVVLLALWSCSPQKYLTTQNHSLWYEYPAKYWNSQGLHLGNGYFGASFMGGVEEETFYITDASMWTGAPANGDWERAGVNPKAKESLPLIRQAVVNNQVALADSLVTHDFLGDSELYGHFTSIGSLKIEFASDQEEYQDYRRELDLAHSLGKISYQQAGVQYEREYFCSYHDQILALKYTADQEGALSMAVGIEVIHDSSRVLISDNEYQLQGYINGNQRPYHVLIYVKHEGGTLGQKDQKLRLKGATSAEIYVTISTQYKMEYPSYLGEDPEKRNRRVLEAALGMEYEELKKRHIADYSSLYDRVSLTLDQDAELAELPTNERFERLKAGGIDPGYKELAFNLGRYMVISSSRPGTLPANLQGVWNAFYFAPWAGNYQSNVNVQQIYWSCGPLNLPECQQAYVDWIEDLSYSGKEIANRVYGTEGWISHTIGNIYGHAAPTGELIWGMYSMGSAWHCQHVWDQYAFTQDKTYLRNQAYPILQGASQFWLENLVPYEGYYITSPTVSAEHGALLTEDGLNPAFHDLESENYRYNLPAFTRTWK